MTTISAENITRTIRNKFTKRCSTCNKSVLVGEGWAVLANEQWHTFCAAHLPSKQPTINTVRRLGEDGYVAMPYETDALPLLRSLPGASFDQQKKQWRYSLALSDRRRVLELAEKLALEIPDSLREIPETKQAAAARTVSVNGKTLFPYQVEGVDWLARQEQAILGDDMGLGKTLQALMALGQNEKVLVVCPAGVKYNWAQEIKFWRPDYNAVVLSGMGSFRAPRAGEIVIANPRILPEYLVPKKPGVLSKEELKAKEEDIKSDVILYVSRYDQSQRAIVIKNETANRVRLLKEEQKNIKKDRTLREISQVPAEVASALADVKLIVDEAHMFRNWDSTQTKKGKQLSRLVRSVWFMTGTPLMNHPNQLYSVLDAGGLASKVFGSWNNFVRLFNGYKNAWGGWVWGQPDVSVPERLRRVMLRRRREEVLPDLPRKRYTTIQVDINSSAIVRKLDALYDEFQGYFESELGRKELPPFEKFSEIRAALAADRLSDVEEYVEDHEEQEVPLVVTSAHRAVVDQIGARPGWAAITGDVAPARRQEIVNSFQAGQLKGIACTIAAAGVGLTMTRAWKMLFVDLDWTPALNAQMEDRICRIGSTADHVEIARMVSTHPLDQHVHRLLEDKIAMINAAVENTIAPISPPKVEESKGETEEEYAARMDDLKNFFLAQEEESRQADVAKKELIKQQAKARVGEVLESQRARATRPELALTPVRCEVIREALEYMISICDGAYLRDGQGFSATDVCLSRFLDRTGMETEDEFRIAERMLSRYYRQLHGSFPELFR